MKTIKHSRQRDSIKAFLMTRYDHPTADTIYGCIREQFPNISLGTVYRNLNLLVELGEIRKLTFDDGKDHFDYDTSPHYHFICKQCGAVMDLPMAPFAEAEACTGTCDLGEITGHTVYFHGICRGCLSETSGASH